MVWESRPSYSPFASPLEEEVSLAVFVPSFSCEGKLCRRLLAYFIRFVQSSPVPTDLVWPSGVDSERMGQRTRDVIVFSECEDFRSLFLVLWVKVGLLYFKMGEVFVWQTL